MRKHTTRKLLRKIKNRKAAIKLNKAKLRHYAKEVKQVALSPAVLGASALAVGAALLWFIPRKLRRKSDATGMEAVFTRKHSKGLMSYMAQGIALASSLSALANMFGRRRHY